jgi:hypothetical protein
LRLIQFRRKAGAGRLGSDGKRHYVTGRKELIERLLAGHYDGPERSGPPPGITLAGVEITNPAAIEKHARMRLEKRLPDVEAFKTCEDFGHLGAECCGSCHGSYEICEMEAVPLPGGGHAWVCCAVDRAIRPEWHAEQHRLFLESGRGKKLRKMYHEIYGGDEKDELDYDHLADALHRYMFG